MDLEQYMRECFRLAEQGLGSTLFNPLVGCLIVEGGAVIGRGYHQRFGGPHAEIEALQSVTEPARLANSTLVVNLEPCCHFGKTPPCTEAIISSGVRNVVVAAKDPNRPMRGKGIEQLRLSGVEVTEGVLEEEARELNRRFYTFHERKRPWVVLKWAQTSDGFIAPKEGASKWISCDQSRQLVHTWRSQEAAILIGSRTATVDNPELTVRLTRGSSPTRIVFDRKLELDPNLRIFDQKAPTLIVSEFTGEVKGADLITMPFGEGVLDELLAELHERKLISLLVEGGTNTLQRFIDAELWDEARVFISPSTFGAGLEAPSIKGRQVSESLVGVDTLRVFRPEL